MYFLITLKIINVFVEAFIPSCHQLVDTAGIEVLGLVLEEYSDPRLHFVVRSKPFPSEFVHTFVCFEISRVVTLLSFLNTSSTVASEASANAAWTWPGLSASLTVCLPCLKLLYQLFTAVQP